MVTTRLHFERHGDSPSFVEVENQGRVLVVSAGRLGSKGVNHLRPFDDEAAAAKAFIVQVNQLERKQFWAGHHAPELMAAIQARPDETGPYEVYADWLLERQDPRGALIVAQASGQAAHAAELLNEHELMLRPSRWASGATLSWARGFLNEVAYTAAADAWRVRRLFRHPSAMVLRRVTLGPGADRFDEETWEQVLAHRPASMRELRVPSGHRVLRLKIDGLRISA